MGNSASGEGNATLVLAPAQTAALEKIVSSQPYMMSDSVWLSFFSMDQVLPAMPKAKLVNFLRPYTHAMAANTHISGNFRMLVRHVTRCLRAPGEASPGRSVLAASSANVVNVLVIVRNFCLHFVERDANQLIDVFNDKGLAKDASGLRAEDSWRPNQFQRESSALDVQHEDDVAFNFLDALCSTVLESAPSDETYDMHLECINTLLTLLASPAYGRDASLQARFLADARAGTKGKSAAWAPGLVKRVLYSYLDELPPPDPSSAASVAALASVGPPPPSWGVMEYFVATDTPVFPLADRGVLLLLLLLHAAPSEHNPFRAALQALEDRDDGPTASHSVSYSHLVNVLGRSLDKDISSMLLYSLATLHPGFVGAITRPLDTELLGLPLLHAIYECTDPTKLCIYLATVLKVTALPDVVEALHATMIDDHISWYAEKYMVDISFGSAAVVVLVRLVHRNVATYRDAAVHSLAFAALFNFVQFASQLHQNASQALVQSLEHWAKKEALAQAELDKLQAAVAEDADAALDGQAKLLEKQQLYMECMRLILGLLRTVLSPRLLPQNPQLMYSLLQAAALFQSLASHADLAFQTCDDHTRVQEVLAYFRAVIDMEEETHADTDEVHVLSVERVFEYIDRGCAGLFPEGAANDNGLSTYGYDFEEDPDQAQAYFAHHVWLRIVEHTSDFNWTFNKLVYRPRTAA
ncbi:dymeclin [Achlya hypogyna]|uniref:Dymeclin n=1 Tax=Achlya hypogyna TaxID=1202772 RepID=A0A1V9YMR0_ACHHY|nr:dymeclin [Achlya hypogyna]